MVCLLSGSCKQVSIAEGGLVVCMPCSPSQVTNPTHPRATDENYFPAYGMGCSTSDPSPQLPPAAWALCTGRRWVVAFGGYFWAKDDFMRSGHWLLVTKPVGAGVGARSREKRPAITPPQLVELHISKFVTIFFLILDPCSSLGSMARVCTFRLPQVPVRHFPTAASLKRGGQRRHAPPARPAWERGPTMAGRRARRRRERQRRGRPA